MPFRFKVKTDNNPDNQYINYESNLPWVYFFISDKTYKLDYGHHATKDLELVEAEKISEYNENTDPISAGFLDQKHYDLLQTNIKFLESKNNNSQFLKQKELFIGISEYIYMSSKNPSYLKLSLKTENTGYWSSKNDDIVVFRESFKLTDLLESDFQEKFNENFEKSLKLVYDMKYEAQRVNQLFS